MVVGMRVRIQGHVSACCDRGWGQQPLSPTPLVFDCIPQCIAGSLLVWTSSGRRISEEHRHRLPAPHPFFKLTSRLNESEIKSYVNNSWNSCILDEPLVAHQWGVAGELSSGGQFPGRSSGPADPFLLLSPRRPVFPLFDFHLKRFFFPLYTSCDPLELLRKRLLWKFHF